MKKIILILSLLVFIVLVTYPIYLFFIYRHSMPVLAYHDVLESPIEETDISIKNFEKQMEYLYKHHYETLSMDDFYNWKQGKGIGGKKVVLTFDDGKESFYTKVVPILEKYNLKATLFIIESALDHEGYLTKEQVRDLNQNYPNITLASHSYQLHGSNEATSNHYSLYYEDLKKNEMYSYVYYAYPFGISNENYVKALKAHQYKLAFLFSPSKWATKKDNAYEIPRVPIYKSNSFFKFKLKLLIKK